MASLNKETNEATEDTLSKDQGRITITIYIRSFYEIYINFQFLILRSVVSKWCTMHNG